jgi:hypothetical protein
MQTAQWVQRRTKIAITSSQHGYGYGKILDIQYPMTPQISKYYKIQNTAL